MVKDRARHFYKIGKSQQTKLSQGGSKWAAAIDLSSGGKSGIDAIKFLLEIDFFTDKGYFRTALRSVRVLTLDRKLTEEEFSSIQQANYDIEEISRDKYAGIIRSHRRKRDLMIKEEIAVYGKRVGPLQVHEYTI